MPKSSTPDAPEVVFHNADVLTAANTTIDQIMAYENGDMTDDEVVEFFQGLVDSGLAWRLQGSYGRQASAFIDAGLVSAWRGVPLAVLRGRAVRRVCDVVAGGQPT